MKHFIVKNEYWDRWGVEDAFMALIDMDEIERLASEWDVDVDDLMEQVEETNWYAVEMDEDDNDWGTGSYNYDDAVAMAKRMGAKFVATIEEGNDPICVRIEEV